jgi:Flp pilus assembly protein TadD
MIRSIRRFGVSVAESRIVVGRRVSRLFVRAERTSPPRLTPIVGYDWTLAEARGALRDGALARAEAALMRAAPIAGDDPAFFNLLGVLHECRGRLRAARRAYGRAIAVDGLHPAAQQNMRRLYELRTFGRTIEPVALGDDPNSFDTSPPPGCRRAGELIL